MSSAFGTKISPGPNGIFSDERRHELLKLARFGKKLPASGTRGMVVTSNPLVSQVAIDVLREGGNTVDAVVAASIAQTVVETSMGGLSGCWGMLYYEAATGEVSYLNSSNNAPLHLPITQEEWNARSTEYLKDGRGVTVPGFWAGIEEALRTHGSLPKKRLCAPAIDFARNGFELDPFLWGYIFRCLDNIGVSEQGREIYMPTGNVVVNPGDKIYQKRMADLLERLVDEGNDYFYYGDFAQKFSQTVKVAGGWVTPEDFAAYRPRWCSPGHIVYRGHDFFSPPAPDYGGQVLAEIFNMLELLDLEKMGPAAKSPETIWRMQQIVRLVGAENVEWHVNGNKPSLDYVLSAELASKRMALLPKTGLPGFSHKPPVGSNVLTVVDAAGNLAVTFHTHIVPWNNGLFVEGVSIGATAAVYGVGLPRPGERVNLRGGMCILLKNGQVKLAAGSPSAASIENLTQTIPNIIDFGMSIEEAVHQPRFGTEVGNAGFYGGARSGGGFVIEADMPQPIFTGLSRHGVPFQKVNPWNWGHGAFEGIAFDSAGSAHSCGDPRRNGQAFAV